MFKNGRLTKTLEELEIQDKDIGSLGHTLKRDENKAKKQCEEARDEAIKRIQRA
jgi:hypothetical protein